MQTTLAGARWAAASSRSFWRSYYRAGVLEAFPQFFGGKNMPDFFQFKENNISLEQNEQLIKNKITGQGLFGLWWEIFLKVCHQSTTFPKRKMPIPMEKKKKNVSARCFDVQDFSLQLRNSDFPKNAITNGKQGGGYESHLPCHRHSELPQVVGVDFTRPLSRSTGTPKECTKWVFPKIMVPPNHPF